jgi:hypothetical protein
VETLLILSAIVVSLWIALFVLVGYAVRGLHRRARDVGDQARLLARTYGVGPLSEVARLRREMGRALVGARNALAAAQAVHSPVGDVPSLLARLELAAQSVDAELRMLEALPNRLAIPARLPAVRSRAEAITSSAARLVDGLLAAAGRDVDELSLLQASCQIEADAMRAAARSFGRTHPVSAAGTAWTAGAHYWSRGGR